MLFLQPLKILLMNSRRQMSFNLEKKSFLTMLWTNQVADRSVISGQCDIFKKTVKEKKVTFFTGVYNVTLHVETLQQHK